jgi:hypothetical protein
MVKSTYCGFQSHSEVERYEKFHEPIVIELADCRLAAKMGRFKLNRKDYPFEMNVRRSVIVNLVGGLDSDSNCKVGLFEVNGAPLRSQVATVMYEIYVRQEWARANDLTGTIKLLEYLMGTTTDQTLVDSGEDTYVWDYWQDACPTCWSACTEAVSRCSQTQRLPSRMVPPSCLGETRTRWPGWS